jgi:hypothetical protein
MLKEIVTAIVFCAVSAPSVWAQTKTIADGACHVTVPANWTSPFPKMAKAPGPHTFRALVKTIDADHYKLTMNLVKSGQMAMVKPKILDENSKRVLIQTELTENNKTTTHYQVMTKGTPSCQGIVDFDDPSLAVEARKMVESTTGAK